MSVMCSLSELGAATRAHHQAPECISVLGLVIAATRAAPSGLGDGPERQHQVLTSCTCVLVLGLVMGPRGGTKFRQAAYAC